MIYFFKMKSLSAGLILLVSLTITPAVAFAQYSSTNYQTNEVFFGLGGDLDASSTNYQLQSALGLLGVGDVSSTNYRSFGGFLTPNEPFLELAIDSSSVSLGNLETTTTKTGTATFHVRAYTDSGYTVQTISQPPQIPATSETLEPLSSASASVIGTEQFGMNLVANTSPASFGANPSPQPDSSFATGQAASGYDTTNLYKYVVGDTIASTGNSGWGATIFTMAYIANISSITEAGEYVMVHDLVVVAIY